MALKSWKRERNKTIMNIDFDLVFIKNNKTIGIEHMPADIAHPSPHWLVLINTNWSKRKHFRTKSQALNYAKSYMRKH